MSKQPNKAQEEHAPKSQATQDEASKTIDPQNEALNEQENTAENSPANQQHNTVENTIEDLASVIDELTQANFQITELEQQLAKANEKVDAQKDSVVRAAAEVDNIRRRSAIDTEKARKFALEKFANELLPVIDNMERALQVSNSADEATQAVHEGVELTLKSFQVAVEKFGINAISPEGQPFNPDRHQAISMQPSDEYPANTVMLVMQKGYLLNDRLLRPAMVMVSQGSNNQDKKGTEVDIEA